MIYQKNDRVSVINFSNRTYNALTNHGIIYISQLIKLTSRDLNNIKNLGKKSIKEILDFIMENRLDNLSMIDNNAVNEVRLLGGGISCINFSNRTYNALTSYGIKEIDQLLMLTKEDLKEIKNLGEKSIKEILNFIASKKISDNYKSFISIDGGSYKDIPIEELNLSKRACHLLKRIGVIYYSDLEKINISELKKINNIGDTTVNEIENIKSTIQLEFLYVKEKINSPQEYNGCVLFTDLAKERKMISYDAFLKIFIPLVDAYVSNNQINSHKILFNRDFISYILSNNIIHEVFESFIIEIIDENLDNLSLDVINKMLPEYLLNNDLVTVIINKLIHKRIIEHVGKIFFIDIFKKHSKLSFEDFIKLFIDIFNSYDMKAIEYNNLFKDFNFIKILLSNNEIKLTLSSYVLKIIDQNLYGYNENELRSHFPEYLKSQKLIDGIINYLMNKNLIEYSDNNNMIVVHESILQVSKHVLSDLNFEVLSARLNGSTLQEIADNKNLTRERIRQLESSAFKKLLNSNIKFKEDKYLDTIKNYSLSKSDFMFVFNDLVAYNYITLRYKNEIDYSARKDINEILIDESIPQLMKKSFEKLVYKNYFLLGDDYILSTRHGIVSFVLKNYCNEAISFEQFSEYYFNIIELLNKSDDISLTNLGRGYKNKIELSREVLCSYGNKFRYYNIDTYEFSEFLKTINLNQYIDVEISTLRIFKKHLILMETYDIRDEYELHNLLKKILPTEGTNINFMRMPNINFGNIDRSMQIFDFLMLHAPISRVDFIQRYEDEFGVLQQTINANYLTDLNMYLDNGIYRIQFQTMPDYAIEEMKTILVNEAYYIYEIKSIYAKKFPQLDVQTMNTYSLRLLGFNSYSTYLINDKFKSIRDFAYYLLSRELIFDLDRFTRIENEIIDYTSIIYSLKSEYEIIEYLPNKYINCKKLEVSGITKEDIKEFNEKVVSFIGEGKFFTHYYLQKLGFLSSLYELGFDDWFYSSILSEYKKYISTQRIGGNKVMLVNGGRFSVLDFIEYLVYKQDNLMIDIYDLLHILTIDYDLNISKWYLINTIKSSSMYYDAISEKIFAEYKIFCEVM